MIPNYILEKLEFPKILSYITKYCITENGKNNISNIVPFDQLSLILT